jgi:hypothetical protein
MHGWSSHESAPWSMADGSKKETRDERWIIERAAREAIACV